MSFPPREFGAWACVTLAAYCCMFQGWLLLSQGISILGQALSLLPSPLSADHEETPLMKPGYATPRFLLSTSLSPGEELAFVACLPIVFS